MQRLFLLLIFLMATTALRAQSFSGSLSCTINDKPWKGTIQTALYSKQGDYLMLAFENETSRLEVTVRQIKNEILPNLPYQDMIQGDFKAGLSPDLIFFVRYFPDKKFVENYANAYTMIKAEFAVDALDVNKKTAAIAFQATCGKATPKYNPMKPDEKDLEKITIKNAESSGVSFLVM